MARPNKPRYREQRDAWVSKIGGVLVTLAKGKRNKAEAERELRRLLVEAEQGGGDAAQPTPTLGLLAEMFLIQVRRDNAPNTLTWYKGHVLGFVSHAGAETLASAIRPLHLTAWLDAPHFKPGRGGKPVRVVWSDSTRRGAITAIKRMSAWGKTEGYLAEDHLSGVRRPKMGVRQVTLTGEQMGAIESARPDREFRDLLTVLREAGCRPSEAARVEARMIDFDRGTITMESKTSRKTGRPRIIHMTPTLAALVRELAEKWPEGPVLRNTRGGAWNRNSMRCRFGRLRAKVGMGGEATAAAYRHSYATDALEAGVPIATVAELMGHSDTTMVARIYSKLHERKDHLRDAATRVRPGGDEPT